MEEVADFKALRARFHAQAEMPEVKGNDPLKIPLPGFGRGGPPALHKDAANGLAHPRAPLVDPVAPGPRPALDMVRPPRPFMTVKDAPKAPLGVFPRPPPSHRIQYPAQEPRASPPRPVGKVKVSGDLLLNLMQQHEPFKGKTTPSTISTMRNQRSLAECPPLRRNLPPEGPRPLKPKRPPHVNLEPYRKAAGAPPLPSRTTVGRASVNSSPSVSGSSSPLVPPKLPAKPSTPKHQPSVSYADDDQDTYDDIDLPPPPPPPAKHGLREGSWTNTDNVHGDEASDEELYEAVDGQEDMPSPGSPGKRLQIELTQQLNMGKKEQKEQHKRESEYKKKFKLTEPVEVLHTVRVLHDWHGGKNELSVRQGDRVEIIRIKGNPEGKWLARAQTGTYGYISNACVNIDYEEVKRLLHKVPNSSFPPPPPVQDDDWYDDVGRSDRGNGTHLPNDMSEEFPPPPEFSLDPKENRKREKEEKEFRKKFKVEGPITVLCNMMVDPNATEKKGSGKDLPLIRGEILEVIQFVNDKKALCRNCQGKYGYVPQAVLLQEEGDVYDDIDIDRDVYDNDSNN